MSREIRSPVYQIDFTAVDAGKRIASSKRRIRWRFGFTNQDALASGETGTACRGEEHDITLIWSLTSGKRLVLADGQEVHYSNSRSQIFDFSWTMRGNHVLKVVSHSTTPMNAHPNFRQYDFFVDGMSFFSMPKVYRLGLTGAEPVQDSGTLALAHSSRRSAYGNYSVGPGGPGLGAVGLVGGGGGHGHGHPGSGSRSLGSPGHNRGPSSIVEIEAPHNEQEEEAYLREAIKASLSNQDPDIPVNANSNLSTASYNGGGYDQGGHGGGGMGATNADDDLLIDFMSEPGPAPAPAPTGQISGGGFDAFAMAMVPAAAPPASIYSNAQPPPNAAPVPSYDQYNAAPAAPAPYAAPFQSVPAPMPMPPANAPPVPTAYPTQFAPPVPAPAPARAPPTPPAPVPAASLTMAPQSTGLGSDANAAYAKFASMDQFDLVKPKNNNAQKDRSNPFDDPAPASSSNSGVGTKTLADMKAKNHQQGGKKEVMKASSMVVAQQQGGSWDVGGAGGGPPAPGGYNNYGMQMQGPPQMQGQYGMGMGMGMNSPPPAMGGMQPGYPPQQQQQQPSGYGQGQPSQQPPMRGAPMQQQYQQPQQGYGYGQPQQQQQPF